MVSRRSQQHRSSVAAETSPTAGSLGDVDGLLALLVVLAGFGAVMAGLAWLAARVRRRGIGDAVMGPFDEIWHPAGHQTRLEIRVQDERVPPRTSPSDR
jgi:hypothetical protein